MLRVDFVALGALALGRLGNRWRSDDIVNREYHDAERVEHPGAAAQRPSTRNRRA